MLPYVHAIYLRAHPPPITEERKLLALRVEQDLQYVMNSKFWLRKNDTVSLRWMSEKDYRRVMKLRQREIEESKDSYSKEELSESYDCYIDERERQLQDLQDEKWRLILFFDELLRRPECKSVPMTGADKALYENMYKCQPQKYLTRPQFLTVIRQVYNLPIAHQGEEVTHQDMLQNFNVLYTAFDTCNQDKMDWRCFLFMVRMIHEFMQEPIDQLRWGFVLYGSSGFMISASTGTDERVRLRDMLEMILTLVLRQFRRKFETIFHDSLMELCRVDAGVQQLLEASQLAGQAPMDTHISYTQFNKLLATPPLAPLFDVSFRHGPPERSPWTYLIEEMYAHPAAARHLWLSRRSARNDDVCDRFIHKHNTRLRAGTLQAWWKFVFRRCRVRYIFQAIELRYRARTCSAAMATWRFWSLASIVVITLQRCYRGYLGRLETRIMRKLRDSATMIQKTYRGHSGRREYVAYHAKTRGAATEIQRHVRGSLARRVAYARVVAYVDNELFDIARERAALMTYPLEYAATRIQTRWRCYRGTQLYRRMRAEHLRKLMVEEQQRQVELEEQRQRTIYMRDIEAFYEQVRKNEVEKLEYEKRAIDVAWDMRRRRRQRKKEEEIERKKQQVGTQEWEDEQTLQAFINHWDEQAVVRPDLVRQAFLRKLRDPVNDSERAEKTLMEKEIWQRVPRITEELDNKGLRLETHQLWQLARDEMIDERMEEVGRVVKQERRDAAVKLEQERAEKETTRAEAEKEEREKKRDRAALTLQICLYRSWKARKLVRGKAMRRYKKRFDPHHHTFFYENTRTGACQWVKPKILGLCDPETRDEWHDLNSDKLERSDALKGLTYFYNPATLRVDWSVPPGTITCDVCQVLFARKRTSKDKKHYCLKCWEETFAGDPDRYSVAWKPIEGGYSKAKETSIEFIPDQFDEDPALPLLLLKQQKEYEAQLLEYEEHQQKKEQNLLLEQQMAYFPALRSSLSSASRSSGAASFAGEGDVIEQPVARDHSSYVAELCQDCGTMYAAKYCDQCSVNFCVVCCTKRHPRKNPVLRTHTFSPVKSTTSSSNSQTLVYNDLITDPPVSLDDSAVHVALDVREMNGLSAVSSTLVEMRLPSMKEEPEPQEHSIRTDSGDGPAEDALDSRVVDGSSSTHGAENLQARGASFRL